MTGRPEEKVRARYRVTGQVQGVGFRWSAVREARGLGLEGWVRNCPDGSVEAAVGGTADDVTRFRAWLEEGPPGALVREVRDLPPPEGALPAAFEIAR